MSESGTIRKPIKTRSGTKKFSDCEHDFETLKSLHMHRNRAPGPPVGDDI